MNSNPEPLTCRCKRMKWVDYFVSMWFDTKLVRYRESVKCPDCQTECMKTGAICYKDSTGVMLSLPYQEGDLLEILTRPKKETTVDKPTPRSYTEISQPLRDAKEAGIIKDFAWHRERDYGLQYPRKVIVTVRNNNLSKCSLWGYSLDEAYYKASQYVAKLRPAKEVAPRLEYLHLRRTNVSHGLMPNGGITIAYTKHGHWYKVGASFCSLDDKYCDDGVLQGQPIGMRLAKARHWSNPSWIHEEQWHSFYMPIALSTRAGRSWYDNAIRAGMWEEWALEEQKHKEAK